MSLRSRRLTEKALVDIWRLATLIRKVEEEIAAKYGEGVMRCPTHLSIGQEGVAAAVGYALETTDLAVSTHRGHAHYLGKGGSVDAMIAELYGKATGCSGGYGGSMHLIDRSVGFEGTTAIVGNSIPIGVGLAQGLKLEGTKKVCCVFLGDGATEEGVFFESVNYAIVRKLPVLFVCENNLYSVYSPLTVRQPEGRKIYEMVASLGIKTAAGDGNDAVAVYDMVGDSLERIRASGCPEFLEFSTYRWREHCGPNFDNHIGYRSTDEAEIWSALDPLPRLKKHIIAEYHTDDELFREGERAVEKRVSEAFEKAELAPLPSKALTPNMVFA